MADNLKLFLVSYQDDNGENQDRFVWATEAEQARKIWFYCWELDEMPEGVQVFFIPTETPAQAYSPDWHIHIKEVTPDD